MGFRITQQIEMGCIIGMKEAHSDEVYLKSLAVDGLRRYNFNREGCPGW
jgi:hypothetical protein